MQQQNHNDNELVKLANEVSNTFNKLNFDSFENSTIEQDQLEHKISNSTPIYQSFNDIKQHEQQNDDLTTSNNVNYSDDNDSIDLDNECLLPEFDWANLEAKLKESQNEINKQNQNERDEIKRKLANLSNDSENDDYIPDYLKKGLISKSHIGQNLQICFMNESISDCEYSNDSSDKEQSPIINDQRLNRQFQNTNAFFKQLLSTSNSNTSSFSSTSSSTQNTENLLSKQQNLQIEIKKALINAQLQAKIQVEQEKKAKKPSPIADIVGLPTYGLKRLERRMLLNMNIGQLQVIVNDLCNQIENTNEDLKKLLIERDDFYMQQDSILVDIEDLTKRLQEYSQKLGLPETNQILPLPTANNQNNSSLNETTNSSNTIINRKTKIINSFTNKFYKLTKKSS